MRLEAKVLQGRHVRLEPYASALREEVRRALDRDLEAWRLFAMCGMGEHFDSWWAAAESGYGKRIAFAVRRLADGRVVGTSSYLNIREADAGVEIGATFYEPQARGGPVNPECKLLLMGQAFEAGAMRVELLTDARNLRSQAAIAKLGAVREGVLRKHKLTWTGHERDTVVYSVIRQEWPAVRAGLEARLAAYEKTPLGAGPRD